MRYLVSEAFHDKYYDEMYDKIVRIILKSKKEIIGNFCDEFFEDEAIMVHGNEIYFIKIKDIEKIYLLHD